MKLITASILTACLLAPMALADQKAIVSVHTNGTFSRSAATVSPPELRGQLKAKYSRIGEFPVLLRCDEGVTFSNAWTVIEIAARTGLWRQGIVANEKTLDFTVAARDGSKSKLSPVMMKGFTGNSLSGGRVVGIRKGSVTLDGQTLSHTELRNALTRLAEAPDNIPIVVIASDLAPMSEIWNALMLLSDMGIKSPCLAKELKMHNKTLDDTSQ